MNAPIREVGFWSNPSLQIYRSLRRRHDLPKNLGVGAKPGFWSLSPGAQGKPPNVLCPELGIHFFSLFYVIYFPSQLSHTCFLVHVLSPLLLISLASHILDVPPNKWLHLQIPRPYLPWGPGGRPEWRRGPPRILALSPTEPKASFALGEAVGVRATICLIMEEPAVSGWNPSQDTLILTCPTLGKP